jgi:hypothetical protein
MMRSFPWVVVAMLVVLPNLASSQKADKTAQEGKKSRYRALPDEVHDSPAKVQFVRLLVLNGPASKTEIEQIIRQEYKSISKKSGFKHAEHPTHIGVYLFETEEKAKAGQGLWLGMLWSPDTSKPMPDIKVHQVRLKNAWSKAEERFGLSEVQRKKVFEELVLAEDRANKESERRFPTDFKKQAAYSQELNTKYTAKIAEKYKLTEEQLLKISVEAFEKGWPLPELR